jgi:hypothetical protein
MARLLRIESLGTVYHSTNKGKEKIEEAWRDKQDHARREGDANKIDLTTRLFDLLYLVIWRGRSKPCY